METLVSPFLALLVALHSGALLASRGPHAGASEPLAATATRLTQQGTTPPPITEIRIDKSDHQLLLLAGGVVVRKFRIAIGSGGLGPKRFEGDKTTPVGTYRVTGRFKGLFHQFLVVSYPSEEDRKRFADLRAQGVVPAGRGVGFGIGLHGVGDKELSGIHKESDWTHGCIALDDAEIDELSLLVKDGTEIVITD